MTKEQKVKEQPVQEAQVETNPLMTAAVPPSLVALALLIKHSNKVTEEDKKEARALLVKILQYSKNPFELSIERLQKHLCAKGMLLIPIGGGELRITDYGEKVISKVKWEWDNRKQEVEQQKASK